MLKRKFIIPFLLSWAFAQMPSNWTVNPADYEHFMTMTSVMTINLQEVPDTNNVIAAFHGSEVRGISSRQIINERTYHFIQVYGNTGDGEITFQAYDGGHMDTVLIVTDTLNFVPGQSYGDPQDPHIFVAINNSMPPVAVVTAPESAREGRLITVDGYGSWCSLGGALTYEWRADPGIVLDSTNVASTSFTAPLFDRDTVLAVFLEVTNPVTTSKPDTALIYIFNNLAPIANAGDSMWVFPGTSVQLNGSESFDPEEDDISYLWSAPTDISLSSDTIAKPTFTAPQITEDRFLNFVLTASDYELASILDTVTVVVSNNSPPVISMVYPTEVLEGDSVFLDGSGTTDPQGDEITYFWRFSSMIALSDTSTHSASFMVPAIDADTTFQIIFGAYDGQYGAVDTLQILAKNNTPPMANAGLDFTLREGKRAELNAYFTVDPDSRPMEYFWRSLSEIILPDTLGEIVYFDAPAISVPLADYAFELRAFDGVDSSLDTINVTIINNMKPVANAGKDVYIKPNTAGTLNGSKSTDMEMDSLSFHWSSPTSIVLSDSTVISPTFTSPNWTSDTSVVITLTVSDYFEKSAIDTVEIFVMGNLPPIANAGPNQMVKPGALVTLDGSRSYDPEGMFFNYSWTTGSGIVLSDSTEVQPYFTAPNYGVDSILTFSLVVNDGEKMSLLDQVDISVFSNFPPIANAGNDTTTIEGRTVILDGSQSFDPEGESLSFLWRVLSGRIMSTANPNTNASPLINIEIISDSTSSTVEVRAPYVVDREIFLIELEVSESEKIARDTVMVMVTNNRIPIAHAGDDIEMKEGQTVYLDGNQSIDPDGTSLTYDWITPVGISLNNPAIATPNFTAPQVTADTSFMFLLRVSDGDFWSKKDTMFVNVMDNEAPIANAGLDRIAISGSVIQLDGSQSSDMDGDPLRFSWTGPENVYLSNPSTQVPEFVAPIVSSAFILEFTLIVSDGGASSFPDTVQVTVEPVQDAVDVAGPGSTPVTAGSGIDIIVTAPAEVNIQSSNLFFAQGGDDSLTVVAMTQASSATNHGNSFASQSSIFNGTIPADKVSDRGLIYKVELTDHMGAVHKIDQENITIKFPDGALSTSMDGSGYPSGIASEKWKMISFPGDLSSANLKFILELGGMDPEKYDIKWKLWEWAGDEWINPFDIQPGKGYWFQHRYDDTKHLILNEGMSQDLFGFDLKLAPGWNLVSSPYTFPVTVDLDLSNLIGPYEYKNLADGWADDFPKVWVPFKSYGIYNTSETSVSVPIRPLESHGNMQSKMRTKALPPDSWSVDLNLNVNGRIEKNNIFGSALSATDGIDVFDHPEPPDIQKRSTFSFTDEQGNITTRNFKAMTGGQKWDAVLTFVNGESQGTLTSTVNHPLPKGWSSVLINKNENKVYYLDGKSIPVSSNQGEVSFIILAGDKDFISQAVSEYEMSIPTEFSLSQNFPNPFNPTTQIQYDVAVQGQVKILVYDIMGRHIRTLVNQHEIPGKYSILWNGTDEFGSKVATGMYFYQFTSPGVVKTKKMVFLK
ncbi:MAG: T9SS type A sorting domain-containing protein [Bacteroidetes bacterium]|nr:T9SS type A sorting domain-containing protein [Bacteroidota bacterium]